MTDLVTRGLAQIPTGDETVGLRKLIAHIDAGKPVLLSGGIYDKASGVG